MGAVVGGIDVKKFAATGLGLVSDRNIGGVQIFLGHDPSNVKPMKIFRDSTQVENVAKGNSNATNQEIKKQG